MWLKVKIGLFNPQSREEQAHCGYCENTRFQGVLQTNREKSTELIAQTSFVIAYIQNLQPIKRVGGFAVGVGEGVQVYACGFYVGVAEAGRNCFYVTARGEEE